MARLSVSEALAESDERIPYGKVREEPGPSVGHRILLTSEARRNLRKLPKDALRRVDARIPGLGQDPRPRRARKLRGAEDLWRVRVGHYGIIYTIEENRALVVAIRVGHRGDVYR